MLRPLLGLPLLQVRKTCLEPFFGGRFFLAAWAKAEQRKARQGKATQLSLPRLFTSKRVRPCMDGHLIEIRLCFLVV